MIKMPTSGSCAASSAKKERYGNKPIYGPGQKGGYRARYGDKP
jgi:hypothetical protein